MANSSLRRVIEVAAPLWAGEAELVRSYWSSPKRTLETDLLWLKRQCFKEFWGSGVTKFDKGGLIPGSLKRLTEETANIDRTMDRHEFLDALEGVKAEFSHYTFFADVYDAVRPKGTPKLHPGMLEEWPEEKALTALRFRHRDAHGALGMRASRTTEGGYCTLFSEGMKLAGRPGIDGLIASASACATPSSAIRSPRSACRRSTAATSSRSPSITSARSSRPRKTGTDPIFRCFA